MRVRGSFYCCIPGVVRWRSVTGFAVETALAHYQLPVIPPDRYLLTGRSDHPGQRTQVILEFAVKVAPPLDVSEVRRACARVFRVFWIPGYPVVFRNSLRL